MKDLWHPSLRRAKTGEKASVMPLVQEPVEGTASAATQVFWPPDFAQKSATAMDLPASRPGRNTHPSYPVGAGAKGRNSAPETAGERNVFSETQDQAGVL